MAISSNYATDPIELEPLNNNDNNNNNIGTPKMKRAAGLKKIQFSTPEFNVTPISTFPGGNNRMLRPSRRREEAVVMANLRKRVAACDLMKISQDEQNGNDTGQEQFETPQQHQTPTRTRIKASSVWNFFSQRNVMEMRTLHFSFRRLELHSVSSKKDLNNGDESPKAMLQDKDFILDCLCWHNEYRARHSAAPLTVSTELCEFAQNWANHLASTNEFYYRSEKNLGQNLFCCPISALVTDLTGQEVASYWYSTVRRYNYFKENSLLHTNVNAGHFTQMVWMNSRYFGIGKATSNTGKIFVVAYYYPPGNIIDSFHENVQPPLLLDQNNQSPRDSDNNPIVSSLLKTNSKN